MSKREVFIILFVSYLIDYLKGYTRIKDDSGSAPPSPLPSARATPLSPPTPAPAATPGLDEEENESDNKESGFSLGKLLGQLAESALKIIEPEDFLEILADLYARLPPQFTSVVGGVVAKAREEFVQGACELASTFAKDVVQVMFKKSEEKLPLKQLNNLTGNSHSVKSFENTNFGAAFISTDLLATTFQVSLKDSVDQHVRRCIEHIPDLEVFIQKFLVHPNFFLLF